MGRRGTGGEGRSEHHFGNGRGRVAWAALLAAATRARAPRRAPTARFSPLTPSPPRLDPSRASPRMEPTVQPNGHVCTTCGAVTGSPNAEPKLRRSRLKLWLASTSLAVGLFCGTPVFQARTCNTLAFRAVARSATHRYRVRRPAPWPRVRTGARTATLPWRGGRGAGKGVPPPPPQRQRPAGVVQRLRAGPSHRRAAHLRAADTAHGRADGIDHRATGRL